MTTTTVQAEVSADDHNGKTRDVYGRPLGPDAVLLRGIIRRALEAFEDLDYPDPPGQFASWVDDNLAEVEAERASDEADEHKGREAEVNE